MIATLRFAWPSAAKIGGHVVYTPGSITKWSRLAGACGVLALVVPEGAYRWAALSIAGVLLVVAATRVPRHAWGAHKALLAALGCVIAAFVAAELLPFSPNITAWIVGVSGGVFVGVVVFSAVRLMRRQKDGTQQL